MNSFTTSLPKIVESQATVRFQHCDPFNHLNNGRYLDYFMNHREDMLIQHYGLNIYTLAAKEGKSWVSTSNQIAYLRPALLMEDVHIESQLLDYNNSELLVEMRMYDTSKSHMKSLAWCRFTHINLQTQRRQEHSKEMLELFEQIALPGASSVFEERLHSLKTLKV